MCGGKISDYDYLVLLDRFDIDEYAFTERVGKILEDDAVNPPPDKLQAAREQALSELSNELYLPPLPVNQHSTRPVQTHTLLSLQTGVA